MADMRATEVWYGRQVDPSTDYADSAAAPVKYVRYTYPAGTTPPPSEMPMVPPPVPPVTHVREPVHPYPPPPEVLQPYLYPPVETSAAAPMPPPPPKAAPPPEEIPVIPGVQYPDGHFEPHPAYVKRPVPVPEPVLAPEVPAKHVTEVAVPVCCEACRERIENYVGEADGVDDVQCDVSKQKVKVVSDIAPADVLQLCRKCFKKSQILDAK